MSNAYDTVVRPEPAGRPEVGHPGAGHHLGELAGRPALHLHHPRRRRVPRRHAADVRGRGDVDPPPHGARRVHLGRDRLPEPLRRCVQLRGQRGGRGRVDRAHRPEVAARLLPADALRPAGRGLLGEAHQGRPGRHGRHGGARHRPVHLPGAPGRGADPLHGEPELLEPRAAVHRRAHHAAHHAVGGPRELHPRRPGALRQHRAEGLLHWPRGVQGQGWRLPARRHGRLAHVLPEQREAPVQRRARAARDLPRAEPPGPDRGLLGVDEPRRLALGLRLVVRGDAVRPAPADHWLPRRGRGGDYRGQAVARGCGLRRRLQRRSARHQHQPGALGDSRSGHAGRAQEEAQHRGHCGPAGPAPAVPTSSTTEAPRASTWCSPCTSAHR